MICQYLVWCLLNSNNKSSELTVYFLNLLDFLLYKGYYIKCISFSISLILFHKKKRLPFT